MRRHSQFVGFVIIQQLLNGISLGMSYALMAVGFSLIFGTLRLIYFAQGAIYAFGALTTIWFTSFHWGILPAILLAAILTGILGIVIDKTALKPLRAKNSIPIASLITTIGLANIIQNLLTIAFGSQKRAFPALFNYGAITVGDVQIRSSQIAMVVLSLLLLVALTLIISRTKIGLAMRATEQNKRAASLMGIDVNYVISFTFFLAGVSAAIAGVLIGGYYQIAYPGMGFMVGLKAFAAAVLGGIGSLPGAIIGGIVIGISESFAAMLFGATYRDAVAFIILILVLIIMPSGFLGKKGINKV